MASCDFCLAEIDDLVFNCEYCGESFCQAHRLPETHECTEIKQATPPELRPDDAEVFEKSYEERETADFIDLSELRERAKTESQPYSVSEVDQTVGTTPEPDYNTSPDVALDGKIKQSGDTEEPEPEIETANSSNRSVIVIVLAVLTLLFVGILFGVI